MEEFFMDILQVNGLTKTYGKGDTIVNALDNVSFSVKKGEFVAVMGASGSGKSTLLHLLGGVDRPTSGKVYIDSKDIYDLNESNLAIFRRRNIGIIYQFYNLIPTLTAEENIMLPRLLDNRKPDAEKLRSILETIGLTDRAKHLPNELSGGQQQRVSVGRALINDPAIILADEPTGNLDSKSSREIIDLLKLSNKRYNQTLLVITHDEKVAMQADRVITIGDGKILRDEEVR
jgi:putative ABC transport system ATP-binding protein